MLLSNSQSGTWERQSTCKDECTMQSFSEHFRSDFSTSIAVLGSRKNRCDSFSMLNVDPAQRQ